MGKIGIAAPDEDGGSAQDNIELGIDGAMAFEGDGPNDYY